VTFFLKYMGKTFDTGARAGTGAEIFDKLEPEPQKIDRLSNTAGTKMIKIINFVPAYILINNFIKLSYC
jgi:hypothetical protein